MSNLGLQAGDVIEEYVAARPVTAATDRVTARVVVS
jgi:hypothetical protein